MKYLKWISKKIEVNILSSIIVLILYQGIFSSCCLLSTIKAVSVFITALFTCIVMDVVKEKKV